MDQWTNEWTSEWTNGPMNQPMDQRMDQWTKSWMCPWLTAGHRVTLTYVLHRDAAPDPDADALAEGRPVYSHTHRAFTIRTNKRTSDTWTARIKTNKRTSDTWTARIKTNKRTSGDTWTPPSLACF